MLTDMPFGFATPHAFSTVSIRAHAPAACGVYGISNARQWIYIGETDNIRDRLLQHFEETGTGIKAQVPTGFTYEVCEWHVRTERHDRLVIEYDPVCNREVARSPKGKI
jgi:excinuclease UvrABC nuclease subunit